MECKKIKDFRASIEKQLIIRKKMKLKSIKKFQNYHFSRKFIKLRLHTNYSITIQKVIMKYFLLILSIKILFLSCADRKKHGNANIENPTLPDMSKSTNLSGKALAEIHCATCHEFVKPEASTRSNWKNVLLPYMGQRMGIYESGITPDSLYSDGEGGESARKANIYPEKPFITRADWKKIVDYYVKSAPDTILPPARTDKIHMGLEHFTYKETSYSHRPPHTIMVKILPENRGVVFSDTKKMVNRLTLLTHDLQKDYNIAMGKAPVHYYEKSDTIYLTTIGKTLFPHDNPDGAIQKLYKSGTSPKYNTSKIIGPNLHRPVFMAYGDLNNDDLEDIVACEFGNLTGRLVWLQHHHDGTYNTNVLNSRPGAISTEIGDFNKDGHKDILALMAQGDEGIFLYENNGAGSFTEKRLLSFSPLNGSQYIELADFNNDGFDDLVYVCGDNADKTKYLKGYHGIYIFLNDGTFNFSQAYFYQLNGAYKAIPRDFDLDGDLDIAAISFFPDYYSHPEESFVYLENLGDLNFKAHSFPESTNGRWIVMDAADMDADGDVDIALGSYVNFKPKGDTTGLQKKWILKGPSVVVLENTIR